MTVMNDINWFETACRVSLYIEQRSIKAQSHCCRQDAEVPLDDVLGV